MTQEILPEWDNEYDEEWVVVLHSKGEYTLSKAQAIILKQAIANNNRQVMFESFLIPIPYIVEFYRSKRVKKGNLQLPETAMEKEYIPIPPEKWEKIRKEIYGKLGKTIM